MSISVSEPENIMVMNQEFIDSIVNATNGQQVKMSSAGSKMLRVQLRETGFLRKIIPPKPITNAELDRVEDHDRPVKIEDKEPESKGAVILPFGQGADTQFYYGPKFRIDFFTVKTHRFTKSIQELRTYKMDLRQVVTENSLKDIQTTEDAAFIDLCNKIVGPNTAAGVLNDLPSPTTGLIQNRRRTGGLTRITVADGQKHLERERLNNGVWLMNRSTAKEYTKLKRDEIGGDLSEAIFKDGLKALTEARILGVPHIFTIKDELVADGEIFMFTEPNFLGRFYTLDEVTMYVEKREDQITFCATETIGFAIGNTAGVQKLILE